MSDTIKTIREALELVKQMRIEDDAHAHLNAALSALDQLTPTAEIVKAGDAMAVQLRHLAEEYRNTMSMRGGSSDIHPLHAEALTAWFAAKSQPPTAEIVKAGDVKIQECTDFWKSAWDDDGTREKIINELWDYTVFMENTAKVYDHLTRGNISKVNTIPQAVIDEVERIHQEEIDEAVKDAEQPLDIPEAIKAFEFIKEIVERPNQYGFQQDRIEQMVKWANHGIASLTP
jgi:hypothetical protein